MMNERQHLLVVSAEEATRLAISQAFACREFSVTHAVDYADALTQVEARTPAVVVLDLRREATDGSELLRCLQRRPERAVVVCLSAHRSPIPQDQDGCVWLQIPADRRPADVAAAIAERVEDGAPNVWNAPNETDLAASTLDLPGLAARVSSTVLISGETGTGKSYLARQIHEASCRRRKPFVTVDCAALAESLAESELFGHEKGAYTGAFAARPGAAEAVEEGTLFFDELADLSMNIQGRLLRLLDERVYRRVGSTQDRPLKARVIGASRRNLAGLVEAGKFREDLYFRFAVLEIPVRPLRQRRDEILPIARTLLGRHGGHQLEDVLQEDAVELIQSYDYPGNIRELRNVLEKSLLLSASSNGKVSARQLAATLHGTFNANAKKWYQTGEHSVDELLHDAESIGQALVRTGGRIGDAAKLLGLSRHALRRRMKKLAG